MIMDFIYDQTWRILLTFVFIIWLFLLSREIYRFRLLISRAGSITTFIASIFTLLWFVLFTIMSFKSGFISAFMTFIFFIVISSIIVQIIKKKRDLLFHPECVAEREFENYRRKAIIQSIINTNEVRELLEMYNRDAEFLRDLIERLHRFGLDNKAISRIRNMDTLEEILKIYSYDYSEEGKIIGVSNILTPKKGKVYNYMRSQK